MPLLIFSETFSMPSGVSFQQYKKFNLLVFSEDLKEVKKTSRLSFPQCGQINFCFSGLAPIFGANVIVAF